MMRLLFSTLTVAALVACTPATTPGPGAYSGLSPASGGEAAAEQAEKPAEAGEGHGGAEHGEKKAKAPDKPKPDSVISSVLSLPIVRKWSDWMDSKDNGSKIVAWGEYVKEVHGSPCWSIVVAEENAHGNTTVWKRFCMQQTGLEMWVETTLATQGTEETNYLAYDKWMSSCQPAYNSPGKC